MINIIKKPINVINKWIYYRKLNSLHNLNRSKNIDDYKKIDAIVSRYRKFGGLINTFQHYKLFSLKELLSETQPLSLLELGSGTTTGIFYDYIQKNKSAEFLSVDESKEWLEKSAQIAGFTKHDRITQLHLDSIFEKEENKLFAKYNLDINKNFDFVMIDGPSLTYNGVKRKDAINSDIIKIIKVSPQKI